MSLSKEKFPQEKTEDAAALARKYLHACLEVMEETIWPSRCAICDAPGPVICATCLKALPYLDRWNACPICGAPFGRIQCSECNPIILKHFNRTSLPYTACVSSTIFDERSGSIVRVYKDQGERRLATYIAKIMAQTMPDTWPQAPLCHIPASVQAYRSRGFDHADLLASELSEKTKRTRVALFKPPQKKDQRLLNKNERIQNMQKTLKLYDGVHIPKQIILIDDVLTTGSTLIAASDALRQAGVEKIYCLTFSRVW
ncbi:MAG: ComF family protein [Eggerthellaceae bacterium]|jgi:ComF family protein